VTTTHLKSAGGYLGYISGMNREQVLLFPESVDEYIEENNPVRFIDAYVDSLDLTTLGFTHAIPKETGPPGYTPADILKLYIYGYLHKIRSSRKLEQETHRNVELMWLLRKLTPDFKTIADFRKDNAGALKEVCREFTLLCKKLDLFGRELIAIDGSKFKAVNSKDRNFTESKLKQLLKHINEKIDTYLKELDQQDTLESSVRTPTADELKGKIAQLQSRRQHYEDLLQQLDGSGASQISLTDPDSRSMKTKHGTDVCYNVQVAVDHQHKLIVEHEVTNDVTDQDQLAAMATRAKDTLDTDRVDALADMGYYNGDEVKKCLDEGIVPYIPKPNTSANSKLGLFGKEDFTDDPQHDCDSCPAGQVLTFRFETVELGRHIRYYSTSACQGCPIKSPCTRNQGNRRITRWVHESLLDDMQQRVLTNPEKVKLRKSLVEHPFGTIKRWTDQGYFLTRGLEKVRGDMSLTILVYHLKRVINIIGVKDLIAAVG
jgi:transposase